jgi:hypothetical protein
MELPEGSVKIISPEWAPAVIVSGNSRTTETRELQPGSSDKVEVIESMPGKKT